MGQAFVKLVSITVGALFLAFFVVIGVRALGFQATFEAPTHAWFSRPFWWIFVPTPEQLCNDSDIPTKDWILELPIVRKDEAWFVPCATPRPLKEFLAASAHKDWLLKVVVHDTWGLDQLAATVEPFQKGMHFALTTEAQKVDVYLRKKAPEWLFAADSTSLLRLRMFESLWVETAIEFWPDFVLADFPSELDARGAAELMRRKKRIIWNWDSKSMAEPPVDIQGVRTTEPAAALEHFKPRL